MINFYKDKKIFITGHTGFIGSWFCKILALAGGKITGYSLPPSQTPNLFELSQIENDVNTIYADIRDLAALKQAVLSVKPEIIIHLAAQSLVRQSYNNPVYTYETNVLGTVNILEAVRECKTVKSFLNITSDKVYKNIECERGYKETDELNGQDPYSNSKSCSELITSSYKYSFFENSQTALSTARLANVIGGGDFAADRIIPDAVRALQSKKELVLRNPNSVRLYQHIIDAAFACLLIAKKQYENKSCEGNYNIAPEISDCLKTSKLADMFYSHFKNAKWIEHNNNNPYETESLKIDASKIKKELCWQPRINIEKAISMTAQWVKAYLNGNNFNKIMNEQINQYL